MLQEIRKFFLNDRIIFCFIVLNLVISIIQDSGIEHVALRATDMLVTAVFLIEMITKIHTWGIRKYCSERWNRIDGILVLISLPSLVFFFLPNGIFDFSVFLSIRMLRIFRSFRIIKFFPNARKITAGLRLALKDTSSVFLGFFVLIVVIALVNCSLFKEACPAYFSTPVDSVYSVFRLFTTEGWYEIPDSIATFYDSQAVKHVVKAYFCLLLIGGGIIGMSFVNSIFVDAMVSDNNDDLNEKISKLNSQVETLTRKIEELTGTIEKNNDGNGRTQ